MFLDRCSEQSRQTLDEFYASIRDGYGGVYAGKTMLSLIAALRKHPDPRRVRGLTSHYHLGFLAADAASDVAYPILVWVVASDPHNYSIEYRLPDEEAPWPDAYVKGTAQSEEEAIRMILLGMDKSKGWDNLPD